jgi:hypothetical protein
LLLCCLRLQLCNDWALGGKGIKKVKGDLWGASTVVLSFLDWPLRRWVVVLAVYMQLHYVSNLKPA